MNDKLGQRPEKQQARDLPEIFLKLPSFFCHNHDDIPSDIVGATITAFGTYAIPKHEEGGGLVIEYLPKASNTAKRVHLGFNELGMWINSEHSVL